MNHPIRRPAVLAAVTAVVAGLLTALPAQAKPAACPTLRTSEGWYGDNRARLQRLIDTHCAAGARTARTRPVAVFDWDNTVVKNDVGDATMYWLLRNSRIRPPENGDWATTSRHLTPRAATALTGACPAPARPARTLPTGTDTRCADEILSVYADGATTSGDPAFAGFDHRRTEPQYAWLAQLLRGWTRGQVASFARAARAENLAAPVGATRQVGTRTVTGWVRYYDQQRDLVRTLRAAGFDVWIASASPEPVVEVWAESVGIAPSRTLGIRNTTERGRLTAHLAGCGGVRDGEDTMITYIDGKRCWINQEVFGVRGPAAERIGPAARRQVFAAGDSDTDVSFLRDATGLRLVLNRNKNELMCRAYDDADGRWIVNPMFIEPKKRKTAPYPCATTGYTGGDGTAQPVRRSDGSVVPDQTDSVYGS